MDGKVTRINRELLYEGHITKYYKDTVLLPDGKTAEWDFVGHNGAAAVIPVLDDGRIVMVRQYRNALDRFTLEIPAGGLNKDEPTIEAARRELKEETGYSCEKIEPLIEIYPTVAYCNEKIDIYLATGLHKGEQHLDDDEYVDVEFHTVDELLDMIYSAKIQDSKTLGAILAYVNKCM